MTDQSEGPAVEKAKCKYCNSADCESEQNRNDPRLLRMCRHTVERERDFLRSRVGRLEIALKESDAVRASVARLVELAEATGNCVLANVREDYRYAPELRGNAGYLLAAATQWRLRQGKGEQSESEAADLRHQLATRLDGTRELQQLYAAFEGSGHKPHNPREAAQAIWQMADGSRELDDTIAQLRVAVCKLTESLPEDVASADVPELIRLFALECSAEYESRVAAQADGEELAKKLDAMRQQRDDALETVIRSESVCNAELGRITEDRDSLRAALTASEQAIDAYRDQRERFSAQAADLRQKLQAQAKEGESLLELEHLVRTDLAIPRRFLTEEPPEPTAAQLKARIAELETALGRATACVLAADALTAQLVEVKVAVTTTMRDQHNFTLLNAKLGIYDRAREQLGLMAGGKK